jgi:hypothetical protein
MNKELNINSRTTEFASPAESYVQETLFNSNILKMSSDNIILIKNNTI